MIVEYKTKAVWFETLYNGSSLGRTRGTADKSVAPRTTGRYGKLASETGGHVVAKDHRDGRTGYRISDAKPRWSCLGNDSSLA